MRVLLVEDDVTTSKSIEMILTTAGMVLDTTDLGEDGLEIGQSRNCDQVVVSFNGQEVADFCNGVEVVHVGDGQV